VDGDTAAEWMGEEDVRREVPLLEDVGERTFGLLMVSKGW